jgi:hypothetical protein
MQSLTGLGSDKKTFQPAAMMAMPLSMIQEHSAMAPSSGDFFSSTNPNHDADSTHGELYELHAEQPPRILEARGQTSPDGHDLPTDAVVDKKVVIGIEGIDGKPTAYARMLSPTVSELNQPVLMVHEGIEINHGVSMRRIIKDNLALKQGNATPELVFARDPAVQTTYNLIKQGLDQGDDILLIPHSGGGAESALALNLLSRTYHDEIHDHVRVMSLAGASAPSNYEAAGVDSKNVLYLGDARDPIAVAGSAETDPTHPKVDERRLIDGLSQMAADPREFVLHEPDTILHENAQVAADFLHGGAGGVHLATGA